MMTPVTYYSIVRYLPDEIRGEQMNIGAVVLAEDGSFAGAKFDPGLQRAKSLGRGADVSFLRQLKDAFEELVAEQGAGQLPLAAEATPRLVVTIEGKPRLDVNLLRYLSEKWVHSIQITEPRASLEPDPLRLLDDVFRRYVRPESTGVRRQVRDRRWIVSRAAQLLEVLVQERFPQEPAGEIVRRRRPLDGVVERHTFELVLERHEVRRAAQALSFEGEDRRSLSREIESVAWAIDDTRKAQPRLPIALLAIELEGSPEFQRAEHICRSLEATFVPSRQLENWATSAVRELALTPSAARSR